MLEGCPKTAASWLASGPVGCDFVRDERSMPHALMHTPLAPVLGLIYITKCTQNTAMSYIWQRLVL